VTTTTPDNDTRYADGAYDGVLQVMDRDHGDYKVMWNKDNEAEVLEARHTFERLRSQRFLAYTVKEDGSQGEVIREFDPEAGRVILAPQLVGG
jgi:hypothetical protein